MGRAAPPFWDRVDRGDGCWEWTGARDRHGAGVVWWEGKTRRAAAVALALTVGHWPTATVKPTCGNRACCRPEHLAEARPARRAAKRKMGGSTAGRATVAARVVYGRGSVRELRRGVWELRLPIRSGVWPSPAAFSRTFQGSRGEAEEALAELREQAQHGGPLRVDPTFGELADAFGAWYQREVDAGVPGAETLAGAGRSLAAAVGRTLGGAPVSVLGDGRAIHDWETAMVDAGRPVADVHALHDAVVRVLGWGVAHGWIRRSSDPRPRLSPPSDGHTDPVR